jgi:hypothetical protein
MVSSTCGHGSGQKWPKVVKLHTREDGLAVDSGHDNMRWEAGERGGGDLRPLGARGAPRAPEARLVACVHARAYRPLRVAQLGALRGCKVVEREGRARARTIATTLNHYTRWQLRKRRQQLYKSGAGRGTCSSACCSPSAAGGRAASARVPSPRARSNPLNWCPACAGTCARARPRRRSRGEMHHAEI